MSDLAQESRELAEYDFDDDVDATEHSGRSRGRGPIITIAVVLALVVATGLTVLGLGVNNTSVTNFDASSWLFSSSHGEVDRVNGITDKVDTRARIKDAQNHDIQVTQTDKYLILRDLETGQVSTLDLTTLQVSAVMATTPGLGVSVALHGGDAFVIDSVQGQVRQLDPRSLAPVGDAIAMPNGIAAGGFDGNGTLWIAVPTEGTVVAIVPGRAGAGPRVLRTVTVAPPGHDLAVTALDEGVAVLDNTDQILDTVHGTKVSTTALPVDKPAILPARSAGTSVPVTVPDDRQVVVVDSGGKVTQFIVPGVGSLAPAVAFAGHVYCADPAAGVVYEFDGSGRLVNQIHISAAGGQLELEVREDHLFINAPDGSTATVVDKNHVAHKVNKYEQGVLGGDPPPVEQPKSAPKPVKTVPGKPQNVSASAGDSSARISWRRARDNGAPITKYVVTGGGQTVTVGANQRTADIRKLVNGRSYRFNIHAVNAMGAGPDATTAPVTPTSDVPGAPAAVTATAHPDGTVTVTWPAANGLGRKIVRYTVTSVTGGAQAPVGDVKTTTMTVAAGSLDYGTQVAFSVVAVNDKGAGSQPSPVSNTVVPFTTPDKPRSVGAATVPNKKGSIAVSWQPAPSNGRPIQKYVVTVGATKQDVSGTSVTLSGFGDDTAVSVKVHAVNQAGPGPDASATARTIGVPTITVTSSTSGYNSVSVTLTPNNKGGSATCKLQITGAGSAQSACTTQPVTLTVTKLWPNRTYAFTASVTTAAGAATGGGSKPTSQLRATVLCGDTTYCGKGIYIYATPNNGNPSDSVGHFVAGNQFTPVCHVASDNVDARPWGGRNSSQWLRLTYQGTTAYFPFAWVNTDGGNSINLIAPC